MSDFFHSYYLKYQLLKRLWSVKTINQIKAGNVVWCVSLPVRNILEIVEIETFNFYSIYNNMYYYERGVTFNEIDGNINEKSAFVECFLVEDSNRRSFKEFVLGPRKINKGNIRFLRTRCLYLVSIVNGRHV